MKELNHTFMTDGPQTFDFQRAVEFSPKIKELFHWGRYIQTTNIVPIIWWKGGYWTSENRKDKISRKRRLIISIWYLWISENLVHFFPSFSCTPASRQSGPRGTEQWFSKCGPRTSSTGIVWELFNNVRSLTPRNSGVTAWNLTRPPGDPGAS